MIDIDFARACVCVLLLSREQRTRGEEEEGEDTGRMMKERAEDDGEAEPFTCNIVITAWRSFIGPFIYYSSRVHEISSPGIKKGLPRRWLPEKSANRLVSAYVTAQGKKDSFFKKIFRGVC